jgi:hypothetical protein
VTWVSISTLSRSELEKLAFHQQAALRRVIGAVLDESKPWWQVRKAAKDEAELFQSRTNYVRDIAVAERVQVVQTVRNDRIWRRLGGEAPT